MTGEVERLVQQYRRAARNLRRQNTNTVALAVNRRSLDAHSENRAECVEALRRLRELGHAPVADALTALDELNEALAMTWLPELRQVQRGKMAAPRKVVAEAIAAERAAG